MLGHPPDRRRALPHGLPVRPRSATRTAQKMSKTKGNVVDPLEVIDEPGADALRFALIHGATPGNDQRFGPAEARERAGTSRTSSGTRPASCWVRGRRRSRRTRRDALPTRPRLGPAERWILSRAAATVAEVDRAFADYQFAEVTRALYDGDLVRVLRLGPGAREGPARRRVAAGRRSARRRGGPWSRRSTRTSGCCTR